MGVIGRDTKGQPIFIDSPQSAIAQLDNAYIPSVVDSVLNGQKKINFDTKQFKTSNPKSSSMVCIKTDAPKRFGNIVSQIQNASLQRVVSDNARIAAVSKAAVEVKLKQLQENAKTFSVSIPNVKAAAEAKLKQLQATAKTLSTEVSNNLDQEHSVASELDILKTKDVVLQNQGGRIKQEIAKMQPLVKNGVHGVHNNSTALTMMIQNNQVAQEQQQLFNIEMERSVALPKEQTDLLNQLKSLKRREGDLSSQIATNSAQIELARTALKLREGDLSSRIATNSAQIELARTTLKALQTTHVVRPSSPSIEPVGPGKSVFIILGAFMGLILSVFYALLAHALASKTDELQTNVF
ncbi:hypothetical protein [Acidithiobacillus sp.]|jgi:hypothetical protein|uniref:hypothetical protein n=1 Tax=Acidithiobacillus sp. TaxID=1872118 RepID=UPI0025BA4420|nr:hypothetical protein [Acidithiobacillus sp.]MCK9188929.1 hypothetical protein [Acidithiobacillus sp.]MCK9358286.1 hypothetical protein [Acidithiobacillus sp.]